MEFDVESWPIVPDGAGSRRRFYTNLPLSMEQTLALQNRGWDVIDVRLLPEDTDAERQTCVRAWLWGLNNGTISPPNPKIYDILDLKAKACGLVGNKEASQDVGKVNKDDLQQLLNVGITRVPEPTVKRYKKQK